MQFWNQVSMQMELQQPFADQHQLRHDRGHQCAKRGANMLAS
jgi:hypothetical protein